MMLTAVVLQSVCWRNISRWDESNCSIWRRWLPIQCRWFEPWSDLRHYRQGLYLPC